MRFYCTVEICDKIDSSVYYNRPGQNLKRDGIYPSQVASEPILDPFLPSSPRCVFLSNFILNFECEDQARRGAWSLCTVCSFEAVCTRNTTNMLGKRVAYKRAVLELAPSDFERIGSCADNGNRRYRQPVLFSGLYRYMPRLRMSSTWKFLKLKLPCLCLSHRRVILNIVSELTSF